MWIIYGLRLPVLLFSATYFAFGNSAVKIIKSFYITLLGEMKPVFCGNFDYEARQSDLERLFKRYGNVTRVDMKSGNILRILLPFLIALSSAQADAFSPSL